MFPVKGPICANRIGSCDASDATLPDPLFALASAGLFPEPEVLLVPQPEINATTSNKANRILILFFIFFLLENLYLFYKAYAATPYFSTVPKIA